MVVDVHLKFCKMFATLWKVCDSKWVLLALKEKRCLNMRLGATAWGIFLLSISRRPEGCLCQQQNFLFFYCSKHYGKHGKHRGKHSNDSEHCASPRPFCGMHLKGSDVCPRGGKADDDLEWAKQNRMAVYHIFYVDIFASKDGDTSHGTKLAQACRFP